MAVPTRLNERWSMDFVSNQLASGRRFRVLNVIDDFSRECIGQVVEPSICGARVGRLLDAGALDIDVCPMEGFDAALLDETLVLAIRTSSAALTSRRLP